MHVRLRLAALVVVAASVTACSPEPNATSLSVGDCFQDEAAGTTEVDVETVDCDEPHDNEVFHVFELEGEQFPSDEEIVEAIQDECLDPVFAEYFGSPYASSEIEVLPFTPTTESWEEVGDREVVCTGFIEGEQVEGSLRGSGR